MSLLLVALISCMCIALIVLHAIMLIKSSCWKSFYEQESRSSFSIGKSDKPLKISSYCRFKA